MGVVPLVGLPEFTRPWHRVQPQQPAVRLIAFAHSPCAADAEELVGQGVVQQVPGTPHNGQQGLSSVPMEEPEPSVATARVIA